IVTFPKDTDAANALKTGKVDAYFGDSPVVAYYITRDASFAFGGQPINPIPVGIALRKNDTKTITGVQTALKAMYADGTMKKIRAKWKMWAFGLTQSCERSAAGSTRVVIVAAFEWHIFWQRIFHPDHVFATALWTTVYIAVLAQFFGVVLG